MDKNSIIGLVLIFLVLTLFFWWQRPSKEQIEQSRRYNDSINLVRMHNDSIQAAQAYMVENQLNDTINDSISNANINNQFGVFASSVNGSETFVTVSTPKLEVTFTTLGGRMSSVTLPEFHTFDSLPLTLFKGPDNVFGLSFFSNNRLINTDDLYFVPSVSSNVNVTDPDGYDFSMRLYPSDDGSNAANSYIEFAYHIPYDDYMIDVSCNLVGMEKYVYSRNSFIDLTWTMDILQQEKEEEDRLNGTTLFYQFDGDKCDKLAQNRDGEKNLSVKTRWVSYKQRFFASTLIAKNDECFLSGSVSSKKDARKAQSDNRYVRTMSSVLAVPYNGEPNESFGMSMYFGPAKFTLLKQYDLGLDDQINIGSFFLNRWINRGIMAIFHFLERFIGNYGVIILLLTIFIKLILSPVTYKSYLSTAKIRAIKPETDELNAKYPNPEDAMKKQQATMELYKKFGVSPMSGCLPMLIQFPILVSMFRFFPVAFELRQKSFLWAHDLSTYDSILDLPFNIPLYGDHVSLFTLLMTASTILYTMITNKKMGQEGQPGMKMMTYLMPIMFLGLFNSYSAGLSYYYLLFNLLSFLQTYIIGKIKPTEKLRAEMLLKAAQSTKKGGMSNGGKSRWEKKLEELQKMQREQARENAKRKR